MASIIKPKRSAVPGKEPLVADLQVGEIAINTADGVLFTKHTDDTIKRISGTQPGGTTGQVQVKQSGTDFDVSWDNVDAAYVSATPSGFLEGTTVQALLDELETEKQPKDPTLTAFAGVSVSANTLVYGSGNDEFSTTSLTSFARTLLDDTDASTARGTLQVSASNTPFTPSLTLTDTDVQNALESLDSRTRFQSYNFRFIATAGQTTFSGTDSNGDTLFYFVGNTDVYLNGSLLDPVTDFTASNGTSIVLTSGAALNDEVQIRTFTYTGIAQEGGSSFYRYVGTQGQTTFSGLDTYSNLLMYDSRNVDVFLNGARIDPSDYTASNGTTVVFNTGVDADDLVFVRTYSMPLGSSATDVTFAPVGNISATNVQAAIQELDSEKQPLDGDLTAIGAIADGSTGFLQKTAANTWSLLSASSADTNSTLVLRDGTGAFTTQSISVVSDFNTPHIDLGATPSARADRRLTWNTDEGTLDIGMDGGLVTQQVGLEQYFQVKADTAITNGKVIMATGAVGGSGKISAAHASGSIESRYIIGVATQNIAQGEFGYVTAFGAVRGIQTNGANYSETWNDGDVLYWNPVSTGGLTKVEPVAPNLKVVVAMVVTAHATNGTLFIRVGHGLKLKDVHDVYINSIADGNVLVYDSVNTRWENASPDTAGLVDLSTAQTLTNKTLPTVTMVQGAFTSITYTAPDTSADQTLDSFDGTVYRSAKYQIQATSGTSYHTTEFSVVHNGSDTFQTEYGTIYTGASLFTVTSSVAFDVVYVKITPVNTGTVFKVIRTAIEV